MTCINKSTKEYKNLEKRYGSTIAEGLIRRYNQGKPDSDYIPTVSEAKNFLLNINKNKLQKIQRGLKANQYLTERGILDYLQGVLAKSNDKIFIVKGWNVGMSVKTANRKEIFEPNLKIMQEIATQYPDIFKLKNTTIEDVIIVEINPRQSPSLLISKPQIGIQKTIDFTTPEEEYETEDLSKEEDIERRKEGSWTMDEEGNIIPFTEEESSTNQELSIYLSNKLNDAFGISDPSVTGAPSIDDIVNKHISPSEEDINNKKSEC